MVLIIIRLLSRRRCHTLPHATRIICRPKYNYGVVLSHVISSSSNLDGVMLSYVIGSLPEMALRCVDLTLP